MPASVPPIVMPVITTALPRATVLSVKAPAADEVLMVTTSLPCFPTRDAAPVFNAATVVRSYTRLTAVTLLTVSSLVVIEAKVLGWVSV